MNAAQGLENMVSFHQPVWELSIEGVYESLGTTINGLTEYLEFGLIWIQPAIKRTARQSYPTSWRN
ncbi:hypothetical protein [Nostoc sp. NZL]|uniref:hypothetical protein n=1 Tax=Nostoc sp. NZL TaxID=2650612 RepID=UPI0018C520BD|nr:hypothetical protein [Nostoc sp. NZL]MBG1243243.1 hypothetical protein [Nostoc sp. NZL]